MSMTTRYPDSNSPLITPILLPVLGDIKIPRKLTDKYQLKEGMKLRDLSGLLEGDLPKGSFFSLGDFVRYSVQTNLEKLREADYPISDVPITLAEIYPYLSTRTNNALFRAGLEDADNISALMLSKLI